jgi:transcriptional regulator with XRE-family HTH domain
MITGSQIRAARALLGWSQQKLADKALLSETAILKMEKQRADSRTSTLMKARQSLESAGVEFINRPDGTIGVLLKADKKPST